MPLQPITARITQYEFGGFIAHVHVKEEKPWEWEQTVTAAGNTMQELRKNLRAAVYGAFTNHGRLSVTPNMVANAINEKITYQQW